MAFRFRVTLGAGSLAVAAALLAAGCDATAPRTACTSPVALTVDVHTSMPRFSWSPACLLYRVEVQDTNGTTMWAVQADTVNAIGPAVSYGVRPAGTATEPVAPMALVSGQQYAVGVFRYASGTTDLLATYLFTQH